MRKQVIFRRIMLLAGLIAVSGILFPPSGSYEKKKEPVTETGQAPENPVTTLDQAPVVAIPGQAVSLEDSSYSIIEVLTGDEDRVPSRVIPSEESLRYLKVLFRAIISPNAP